MAVETISIDLGNDREITVETGKIALLAGGSVTVTQGETVVLVCACSADPRPGLDFFPLQVDYREKFSAAGMMPGGYFKREGRPSEKEILTARMTDRPLRPLFPNGFIDDVQIMALLLSADQENDPDVLSMFGASVALTISDIPFGGPVGALRVGRVNGEFIANPTHAEMEESDLDLVYAGIVDKTIMIEGAADEVSEEVLRDALAFANDIIKLQVAAQQDLQSRVGKAKYTPKLQLVPDAITAAVTEFGGARMREACQIHAKNDRYAAVGALKDDAVEALAEQFEDVADASGLIKKAIYKLETTIIRSLLLDENLRSDGRKPEDLRQIECETAVLPRTHGSSLFARGETQSVVVTTLGSGRDTQDSDGIAGGPTRKHFYLHYNFPNYSVGETGRIMGPGRREIGHGALAERSVARMMPTAEEYPYSVRCVSEVMGSNGSTSMASICGASLALFDAGVPLKKPVAGISCGLVQEGDRNVLITDILGSEDHHGDMDFKVAGTPDGITGFQLDLKIPGISIDLMYDAMLRNKTHRLAILDSMNACLAAPREEVSKYAPQMHVMKINPDKIGALIGPGGKVIKGITEEHGVDINIEDDGTVQIFARNGMQLAAGVEACGSIVAEVEIGKIYHGEVKTVKDFGAFVEVLPGQDGLLHISELADHRVKSVEDIVKMGEIVPVKVLDVDDRGRIRLSRRAALEELGEDAD
jgi:polyribonucleotide nucleotidyltransferase